MSELISPRNADLRRSLLSTVSILAMVASVCASHAIAASDSQDAQPWLWIELGGQMEKQTGQGEAFMPDFISANESSPGFSGIDFRSQTGNGLGNGFEGKLDFRPSESDWQFSASVRYGRANARKDLSHVTPGHRLHYKTLYLTPGYGIRCCVSGYYTPVLKHAYSDMQSSSNQAHMVLDFLAGRDVGLGLFGNHGSSVISAGVRFAQFSSRAQVTIHGRPDRDFFKRMHYYAGYSYYRYLTLPTHRYSVTENNSRSFHGIGPTIAWNGSADLLGAPDRGEVEFDWGGNAAALFGRQRAAGSHHASTANFASSHLTEQQHSASFDRKRSVTVLNVGGFAGLSFRYLNAKVSLGYRADTFFNAMDAGNDVRKTETVGFYGPFASVSVGIGG